MATGTVKWFNEQKGYGFISPDQGGRDVFVHISAVERSGLRSLADGQKVSYDVEADRRTGKESATNLKAGRGPATLRSRPRAASLFCPHQPCDTSYPQLRTRWSEMSFKDPNFGDRLASASRAKTAAVEKFRARPAAGDPVVLKRQAERAAIQGAREARAVERGAARLRAEEADRVVRREREEQDRVEAAARREREVREAAEQAQREAALETERKAARDARYAARKARK